MASSEHGEHFSIVEQYGKIKCNLTGHELNPEKEQEFYDYVTTSSKYLSATYNKEFDFDFCKFIIPHKT